MIVIFHHVIFSFVPPPSCLVVSFFSHDVETYWLSLDVWVPQTVVWRSGCSHHYVEIDFAAAASAYPPSLAFSKLPSWAFAQRWLLLLLS